MSVEGNAGAGRGARAPRSEGTLGLVFRLVVVALVVALLIWALAQAADAGWWLAVGFFAFALVALIVTYLTGRFVPLKYLLPGLLFLIVFQLYTMAFTGFSSFTNYGTGHLDDKDSAIVAIEQASVAPVEGGREYQVVPIVKDGVVSMLIVDPDTGAVSIGTNEGVTPVPDGPGRPRGRQGRPASSGTRASTSAPSARTRTTPRNGTSSRSRWTRRRGATCGRSR